MLATAAFTVFAASALAQLPAGHAAELPFENIEALQGLTQRWEQGATELGLPGFSVALVKDGEIIAMEGFGQRDATGGDVDPDTIFYIASCTKTYNAMGILKLVGEGKIDLDAPVKNYLPRFELADSEATHSITVRDLLSHKPGINDGMIVLLDAYTGQITEDRYYHWLSRVEPTGEVTYTNVHFTILGRVIESVSGQPWREYLDEHVFDPAGMLRTTGFASEMYGDANAAFPLETGEHGLQRCAQIKSDDVMHAAGGLGTSAYDAARWLLLNMNGGEIDGSRILSTDLVGEMHARQSNLASPQGQIRRREGFGLGWMHGIYRDDYLYLEHGGGYIGTAAHMSFMPEEGIGVIVLANAAPAGQAMTAVVSIDIYDRLLGIEGATDLLPRYIERIGQMNAAAGAEGEASAPTLGASHLSLPPAAYEGSFTSEFVGTVAISWENDRLIGRLGDLTISFAPTDAIDAFGGSTSAGDDVEGRFAITEDGGVGAIVLEDETYGDLIFGRD